MQMSIYAYCVAGPRAKCRDLGIVIHVGWRGLGDQVEGTRGARWQWDAPLCILCLLTLWARVKTMLWTFLMPTQEGITWKEAGSVTRRFLCSRVLWERVWGRFISLIWDTNFWEGLMKKGSRAAVSMIPHASNRFLSKHTRQMDGWPVPKALQGRAP